MISIKNILKVFNEHYPTLTPTKIYQIPDGYLIIAPISDHDYNDPYYFIDENLTKATAFNMKNKKQMFSAFSRGPIWTK